VLIKVLINQDRNFWGNFQALCKQALIDHYTTSCDHLEPNGLAKKVV
jgi:hypothetical protein